MHDIAFPSSFQLGIIRQQNLQADSHTSKLAPKIKKVIPPFLQLI